MRLLHVTTFLQGGAGRIITDLALAQQRAGHDVQLVTDAGHDVGYGNYPEYLIELDRAGVPIHFVYSTFRRDPTLNGDAAAEIRAIGQQWRPDIVHAHAATPGRVARLAGFGGDRSNVPLVHTMHGWGVAKTAAHSQEDIRTLTIADGVAVPSAAAADTLRKLGLTRLDVRLIPYGLEPCPPSADIDPADAERLRGVRRPIALCVGTYGERKNQELLVDALAHEAARHLAAVFMGDGDAAPILRRAAERGVQDRVIVLGHRADASRYLAASAALVLPSRNEGLPVAVLEALRAGVPVVATALPEMAEALGADASEFLFEMDNAVALAMALRSACEPGGRARMEALSRHRFRGCYTRDLMVSRYAAWYVAAIRTAREPMQDGAPSEPRPVTVRTTSSRPGPA